MKLHYYPETDSLCIALQSIAGSSTREVVDGLNVGLADDGSVVGLDIDGASRFDLSTLDVAGVSDDERRAA